MTDHWYAEYKIDRFVMPLAYLNVSFHLREMHSGHLLFCTLSMYIHACMCSIIHTKKLVASTLQVVYVCLTAFPGMEVDICKTLIACDHQLGQASLLKLGFFVI